MEPNSPITRKDIARNAGISENTVKRREQEWGLHEARSGASHRPVLYFREKVNEVLLPRRIISRPF